LTRRFGKAKGVQEMNQEEDRELMAVQLQFEVMGLKNVSKSF
jgi:hypothetical protein